jgi:hypothetical protein
MRTINVVFEDKEFKALEKIKKDLTWHDFILTLLDHNCENDHQND